MTVARQTGTAPAALTDPATPAGPSVVKVTGSQGNWQLQVNGAAYEVRGLTYGPPQAAADGYMRDLKSMGVNTIRTWGVDDANTPTLLNKAAQQGIKVVVGHWLNQGADYVNDTAYKTATKTEIVNRVNTLKNNQGVLMWDVGNEVILTMQDHGCSAADVEARRVAYAKFVNEVAVAIHAADPNHPVTSTDAWTGAWPYYKQYSPALDLLAVNSYGAIGGVKQDWIDGGYTKPYIVTEGGPAGEWEVPNDVNGVPTEPTDLQKRAQYTASWNAIKCHPGVALGATEFHYGTGERLRRRLAQHLHRRLAPARLLRAEAGLHRHSRRRTPRRRSPHDGRQPDRGAGRQARSRSTSAASDPQRRHDPLQPDVQRQAHHRRHRAAATWTSPQTGDGTFTVTAPEQLGVWKVYVYAFDGQGNVGIETASFKVVPPVVAGHQHRAGQGRDRVVLPADRHQRAAAAVLRASTATTAPGGPASGSTPRGSRSTSARADVQQHPAGVGGGVRASRYQIQTSNDGTNWTTIYSTTAGNGGFDDLNVSGTARYVRMNGQVRATAYGYSLWEFGRLPLADPRRQPRRAGALSTRRLSRVATRLCRATGSESALQAVL